MTLTEHIQPLLDKRLPAAFVAMLLLAMPAIAADTLEPETGTVAGYEPAVTKVLKGAFDNTVALVIAEPSFQPEYAVGVAEKGGRYSLFYVVAREHIWSRLSDKSALSRIGTERREYTIPSKLALRIVGVWQGMLKRVHAQPGRGGVDGEFYFFSAYVGDNLVIGQTWSPSESTDPGKLVALAMAMRETCLAQLPGLITDLSGRVDDLEQRLRANPLRSEPPK